VIIQQHAKPCCGGDISLYFAPFYILVWKLFRR
jgi:hypothetical protein